MKAIILAAGFGKRLNHITIDTPKALLEVSGKPVIDHLLSKIDELSNIDETIIVTNNVFHKQFLDWSKGKGVKVINDNVNSNEERLGAIGDLYYTIKKERIYDDILVFSSDIMFDFSLKDSFNIFKDGNEDVCLFYDVENFEDIKIYGETIIKDNYVEYFKEKPEDPISTITDVSIFFFKKNTIKHLDKFISEGTNKDSPGRFLEYLYKIVPVYAYLAEGKFMDIGSAKYLAKARETEWNNNELLIEEQV